MNIYFAPLEGITGFVLRNAYESCFPGTIDNKIVSYFQCASGKNK